MERGKRFDDAIAFHLILLDLFQSHQSGILSNGFGAALKSHYMREGAFSFLPWLLKNNHGLKLLPIVP